MAMVSYYSEEKRHYRAKIFKNGRWMFYDGLLLNWWNPVELTEEMDEYFPSLVYYVLEKYWTWYDGEINVWVKVVECVYIAWLRESTIAQLLNTGWNGCVKVGVGVSVCRVACHA